MEERRREGDIPDVVKTTKSGERKVRGLGIEYHEEEYSISFVVKSL